ncbi:hypothetical protein E2C01_067992 [Portunus trituberculatus]|uniref:Uncharacterized protein n=1 Tax=Portunus trituberculatus TaxID=210409 RepID=A0A5B7HVD2_PORTR|nr:hypothetical protein [Portunus trituberculatus]
MTQVLVEVMRMKAAQQVEESQLRYSQQVLQQQYRETTALVSEARRSLNALTPVLNTYRRKVRRNDSELHVMREFQVLLYTRSAQHQISLFLSRYNEFFISIQ